MPRKAEPSFELKIIVWDLAANASPINYEAIRRQVDNEIRRLSRQEDFCEDTPDVRTIKRIIEEDMNKLAPEVVVSKLPSHVWHLRKDYESIKQLSKVRTAEEGDLIRQHDAKIFEESDAILSEQDIEFALGIELEAVGFIGHSEVSALVDFDGFFSFGKETNKYINLTLRSLSESVCQKLVQLQPLIHNLFIEGSTYDGGGKKIHGLVLSELMPPEDIRQLMQLSASCRAAYRSYRAAVRDTLFL